VPFSPTLLRRYARFVFGCAGRRNFRRARLWHRSRPARQGRGTKGRALLPGRPQIEGEKPWRYKGAPSNMYDVEHKEMFDAIRAGKDVMTTKPFERDPAAALALLRLHALSGETRLHELAQRTLEVFAGVAGQFGVSAGTYALASAWMARERSTRKNAAPLSTPTITSFSPFRSRLICAPISATRSAICWRE